VNEWREWKQKQEEKLREKLPQPAAKLKKEKKPLQYRKITEDEAYKLKRLQGVSTAWGSSDKRFIHGFNKPFGELQITDRQGFYIQILWYKYRKQLGHNDPKPEGYEGRNEA
jgi:hypothetical protein